MCDAKHLFMDSLHDDSEGLEIKLSDWSNNTATARFRVTFKNYPAYRNIQEEYRLALWKRRDALGDPGLTGWAFTVPNSPWAQEFAKEPILEIFNPSVIHYLITTENDVVEVLSAEEPAVEQLA